MKKQFALASLILAGYASAAVADVFSDAREHESSGLSLVAFDEYGKAFLQSPSLNQKRASLERMLEIRDKNPTLKFPSEIKSRLKLLLAQTRELSDRTLIWNAALVMLTQENPAHADLGIFADANYYALYAAGVSAAARGDNGKVVSNLDPVVKAESLPAFIKPLRPNAQILLARAHYAMGNYATASAEFAKISARSAEFADGLVGRGWAELQAQHYPEALGAATNFEMGAMANEFQPEALVIKSMGLNELCQFPGALKTVRQFQAAYRDSFLWLKKWQSQAAASRPLLYDYAMAAVNGKIPASVPARLAKAWTRAPQFLAEQDAIHRLFNEEAKARAYLRQETHPEVSAFVNRAASLRAQATARVNRALDELSRGFLKRLNTAAENLSLVQVEIYNGASHDMIFRNANPGFAEESEDWKLEAQSARASRIWDWGSMLKRGEKTEIWQDEFGSLQAQTVDQCSNKKKYLQIKGISASR